MAVSARGRIAGRPVQQPAHRGGAVAYSRPELFAKLTLFSELYRVYRSSAIGLPSHCHRNRDRNRTSRTNCYSIPIALPIAISTLRVCFKSLFFRGNMGIPACRLSPVGRQGTPAPRFSRTRLSARLSVPVCVRTCTGRRIRTQTGGRSAAFVPYVLFVPSVP